MSAKTPYRRSLQAESSGSFPSEGDSSAYGNPARKVRGPTKAAKRIRGEIACAECRRLKIRCDRLVPCSTCVKRGCGALCPNGTIPPGESGRFVLAATDHLRRKMINMEARMHSLEDALAIIHGNTSEHPLLSAPDEDDENDEPILKPIVEEASPETSALADALGTLHIDGRGASRFFGPSGGSESLLIKAKDIERRSPSRANRPLLQELDPSYLPPEINHCYQSFPFSPPGISATSIQSTIETFLPPVERAITLCDTFLEHLSWMFHIVSRQQMVKELIPLVYKRIRASYGPHDLALMLIVLGIGSLVDLDLDPYSLEAQHYYRLARAALALQPVLGEQSVVTIKVLHLMSIYNGMSGKESNLEQSYALLDLAGQVALRIGFRALYSHATIFVSCVRVLVDIDPSLWGFEGKEAYERRVYFWNLMAGVLWQSLVTGRPPALLTSFIDCRIPTAEDENLFQQGEVPLGFGIWGFKASLECLIPLVRTTLAVKPPTYQNILDLDLKIRNLALPLSDDPQDNRTAISMRIFVRSHYQDLMLLFLHRGFFAQAMSESPANPLQSSYGQSVSAAYASACVVLEDTKMQFSKKPLLCARVWRIWSLAFSAAVIVGTVAIQGMHLNLDPPAFEEFESACIMFRSAAETSSRAARAMPILHIMLQKAFESRKRYNEQLEPVLLGTHRDPEDELSIFGGRTRLVNPEQSFGSPAPSARSNQQSPARITSVPPGNEWHTHHQPSSNRPPPHINHTPGPNSYLENVPATFADLSGGWEGLFHEGPGPSYGLPIDSHTHYPAHEAGEAAMLDDRWSSFMHNYSILAEPAQSHYTSPQSGWRHAPAQGF